MTTAIFFFSYSHPTICSIIRAVHVRLVYTDTQTGHEKVLEGHAWVGKLIFFLGKLTETVILTVRSPSPGAFNFHTVPVKRRFYKLSYF